MRLTGLIAIALSASVLAQQPPAGSSATQNPTFRAGVTFVEIDAVVTDRQGRSVGDLQQGEFTLLDNGKPQDIATFARVDIPVGPSTHSAARAGDVVSADSVSNAPFDGRVVAIVLDAQQTSFAQSRRVIDAATRFVQQYVGAHDLIAVVGSGGTVAQHFTAERAFVLRAIDRFRGGQARPMSAALEDDMLLNMDLPNFAKVDANAILSKNEQCMNIMRSMGTVRALSAYLGRLPHRRKTIVLFGNGVTEPPDCNDRIVQDTVDEVNRAGVTVYGVDVRGLVEAGTPITSPTFGADPGKPGSTSAVRDEAARSQDALRYLSTGTGGFASVNFNDLGPAFSRIMQEMSSYYLIGFYPSESVGGSFHAVDVKVARPGVEVRTRKGYLAPATGRPPARNGASRTSAALSAALASPIAASDLPLHVSAAAFRGDKGNAALSLTIEVDASAFAFHEVGGQHTDSLELAVYAARGGTITTDAHEMVDLSLGANYQAVRDFGLRLGHRFEVPPGQYRLLVGLRESNGGLIGTLPFELDVPDFSAPSMSSIVIASAQAARMQTARPDLAMKGALPSPPTARRVFDRDDSLAVFAEAYGRSLVSSGLTMTATVEREDGTRVSEVAPGAPVSRAGASAAYTGQIDLRGLTPGRYVLTVSATRPGARPIARATPFEVR
jgi:VWFA-related protein